MGVLLTGAAGLLGTWLRGTAPAGVDVVSLVHRRSVPGPAVVADLRDRADVQRTVAEVRPTIVIHAAFARDKPSVVDATRNLADAAAIHDTDLVFVSSEAVFSGDGRPRAETDPPDPVWDYGEWKAAAEAIVTNTHPGTAIVRLPLIISSDPEDHILGDIRAAGAAHTSSTWFTDEMRQPALGEDLANAIWAITALTSKRRSGLWHLPGPERLSRFEIAARTAAAHDLDASWIRGEPTPGGLRRPRDLHLTGERAGSEIGWAPRPIYRRPEA